MLGDRLEIGSEIESHAAYLGHWIELLKESPKVLLDQAAARQIKQPKTITKLSIFAR